MNFIYSPFTAPDESDMRKVNRWSLVLVLLTLAPLVVALGVHLYFRG